MSPVPHFNGECASEGLGLDLNAINEDIFSCIESDLQLYSHLNNNILGFERYLNDNSPLENVFSTEPTEPHEDHCYSTSPSNAAVDDKEINNENFENPINSIEVKQEMSSEISGDGDSEGEIDVGSDDNASFNSVLTYVYRPTSGCRKGRKLKKTKRERENADKSRRRKSNDRGEDNRSRHNRMERQRRNEMKESFRNVAEKIDAPPTASKISILNRTIVKLIDWENACCRLKNKLKTEKAKNVELTKKISMLEEYIRKYENLKTFHVTTQE